MSPSLLIEADGAQVSVNTVILPETFSPVILTDKARRLRLKTRRWALHSKAEESDTSIEVFIERNLFRPIQMLLFEPICLAFSIFNAFSYGILCPSFLCRAPDSPLTRSDLLLGAIPVVFQEGRGWDPIKGSLPFFFVFGGVLVAAVINIVYSREVYAKRLDAVGSKELAPEVRLPPMSAYRCPLVQLAVLIGRHCSVGIHYLPHRLLPSRSVAALLPLARRLIGSTGWTSDPSTHWLPSVRRRNRASGRI